MNQNTFALLGNSLGHSLSGVIHKRLFSMSGLNADYVLRAVPPERLDEELSGLFALRGFNVTIPYKCAIIPYLKKLSPKASLYGAVNTVKCGEEPEGFNTDCEGLLRALAAVNLPLEGRVLLCGAGGVARMAAFESALHGCSVIVATRESSAPAAEALCSELRAKVPGAQASACLLGQAEGEFDLLINGTPAGMFPNTQDMAVSEAILPHCRGVFDTIYNPLETRLVREARALGIPASGGLAMLVYQAVAAQELWMPVTFTKEQVERVVDAAGLELRRRFGGKA